MMEDKAKKFIDSRVKEACKEQGGAFRDQGPNSVGGKGGFKDDGTKIKERRLGSK